MLESEHTSSRGGITLVGAVFIVFLILKLAEIGAVASWSWWWVTSPLWISALIAVAFLLIILIIAAIAAIFD